LATHILAVVDYQTFVELEDAAIPLPFPSSFYFPA
jgi:hypothetical protein